MSNVGGLMDITMDKIKGMVDVDSVIGSEIKVDENITVIPVSKISYGFAAGGSDFTKKNSENNLFGGGSGTGVTISPVGFLVINNGSVVFLQVESFQGAIDRLIAMAPEIINKVSSVIKKK